jgi:hypothetical protein
MIGNNLSVTLAVDAGEAAFSFEPLFGHVKSLLDHRCLFEDEPRFQNSPSTLELVTEYVAKDLFGRPLAGARWVSVEVCELDRFRCTMRPGQEGLSLSFRHRNLTLEIHGTAQPATGILVCREEILRKVDETFAAFAPIPGESQNQWSERLFMALKSRIPTLGETTVDLGRHRSVRLAQGPSPLR